MKCLNNHFFFFFKIFSNKIVFTKTKIYLFDQIDKNNHL